VRSWGGVHCGIEYCSSSNSSGGNYPHLKLYGGVVQGGGHNIGIYVNVNRLYNKQGFGGVGGKAEFIVL
jgi:hypothetical protein